MDFREADLILKFLDSEGEKLEAIARGAKKSKKRFSGGLLEPLNFMELSFSLPSQPSSQLWTLNEAQLIYDFAGLRVDYDRIKLALYLLKLVTRVDLESGSSEVFDLLLHALKSAETSQHLSILKSQFELKFLHKQGVLGVDKEVLPFLKASLYEGHTLKDLSYRESVLRRSSFEIENYFEQFLELS